jgi:hypothetical protein
MFVPPKLRNLASLTAKAPAMTEYPTLSGAVGSATAELTVFLRWFAEPEAILLADPLWPSSEDGSEMC